MDRINPRKIYIGNIPSEYTEKDLENDFAPHGPIHRIEFKGRFGFVEYDSTEDATKALAAMVGAVRFGERLLVKTFRHIPPRTPGPMGEKFHSRPSEPLSKGQGQSRRTPYRVAVLGLHEKTSWQDLKDFGRKVGDVNYADVHRNAEGAKEGVLEYFDEASMKAALRRLSGDLLLGQEVYIVAAGDCGPIRGDIGHNSGSVAGGPPSARGHFDGYLPEESGAEYHHHHGGRPIGGIRERGASRSRSFRRDSGRPSSRSRGECRSRRCSHVGSSYSPSGSIPCERVHRSSRDLEDTRMSSYVDDRRPAPHHHPHIPPAHFSAVTRSPRGYHEPPTSGVMGRHGYGAPTPSTSSSAGGPPRGSHGIGGSYVPGESLRGAEGGNRDVVMSAGRMPPYTGGSGGRPSRGGSGGFVPSPTNVREDISAERGRAILPPSPSRHFPTVLEPPRHGVPGQPGCRDLSPPPPHHYHHHHHHHRKPLTATPGTYPGGRHHEHSSRGRSPISSYVPHHHGASGEDGDYRGGTAKGYYMYPSETGEPHHSYRPPLPRHSSRSLSHPGHRHPPRSRGGGGGGSPGAYIPSGGHRPYSSRRSPPLLSSSAANAGPLGVDGSNCPPPPYTAGSPRRGGSGYGSGYQNGFTTGNRGDSDDLVAAVDPRQQFKTRRPRSREGYIAGGNSGQRLRSRSPYCRPMRDEVLDGSPSPAGVAGLGGRGGDGEPRGSSLSGGALVGGTRDSRPPFGGGGHAGATGQHGGGGTMATSPLSSGGGGIGRGGVRSPSPGVSNRMDSVHKAPSGGGGGNSGGYWFEKARGAERSSRRETLGATAYSGEKR